MGWYSLYRWFRPWRKLPYVNYIKWYNDVLEQQWLETLTPDQREAYDKKKKQEQESAMRALKFMAAFVAAHGKYMK